MDALTKMTACVDSVIDVAGSYFSKKQCDDLSEEFLQKKHEVAIRIMLFGSYNAGKSSLINALTKGNNAPIGEVPTTAEVLEYVWNDCVILDTPGVNAPIEHELVTESQIKRSAMILFVIRTGDQDVRDVYDRMISLITEGKQVFVVLNHSTESDRDLQESLDKLQQVMIDFALKHDVAITELNNIPVIPVNLKSAIRARAEFKSLLEESSGILELEAAFESWIRQYDTEFEALERLKKYVYNCITSPLISELEKEQSGDFNKELHDLQYSRDSLSREFHLINTRINTMVLAAVNRSKSEIAQALTSGLSEASIDEKLQLICDGLVDKLAEELEEYIGDSVSSLIALAESKDVIDIDKESNLFGDLVESAAVEYLRKVDSSQIKEGLLLLRKLKVPKIKGRWEKTLNRWAGRAAVLLQAAVLAYEMHSASKEQEKQNMEARRQALSLNQAVDSVANRIEQSLIDQCLIVVDTMRIDSLKPIEEKIQDLVATSDKFTSDAERLKSLVVEIESI
ncbi:MAG: hypothetical protein COB58_00270 [Thalassobium sp.]|nr:MAG: hypothetical protein COB58_12365 [Thalassobium sp.]PHQ88292.1 MAG: hypothetical protein COB58_00270 [Thalassobium sp.]